MIYVSLKLLVICKIIKCYFQLNKSSLIHSYKYLILYACIKLNSSDITIICMPHSQIYLAQIKNTHITLFYLHKNLCYNKYFSTPHNNSINYLE